MEELEDWEEDDTLDRLALELLTGGCPPVCESGGLRFLRG